MAVREGNVEAAELLLSKGAAVDSKDNDGPGPQRQGQKSHLQIGACDIMSHVWPCLHELNRVRIDSGYVRIVSAELRS